MLALLMLLLMLGGVLAACASQPPTAQTPPEPAPTSAPAATAAPDQPATAAPAPTAAPEPVTGGTVTIGLDSEPPTLDPHASPSAITFFITASVGESLLYLDENRELKPWLAESWEVEDDGASFVFKLREDVTFQDGTPFNAEVVKWNFDRIVDPNYAAGSSRTALVGYTGTEVVDEYTAKVTFEEPYAPFLTYAAAGTLAMLSPEGTQAQGDEVNATPIMSGPYQITEYLPRESITITRWDGYNRTLPWTDRAGPGIPDQVIWKFIPEAGTRIATVESGETQIASVVPAQDLPRLQSDGFEIVSRPWVGLPRIWSINITQAPTDDVLVRRAINYAINKQQIVDALYNGTGTPAIGPATAAMLDDPSLRALYPYDPEQAKALLEEAGWTGADGTIRTKDGQPLTIILNAIDPGSGPGQLEQFIQGQLREVGIDVQLKTQARAPWYEDNYACTTNGPVLFLRSGDLDGLAAFYDSNLIGSNFNFSCVNDPELDALLAQGRSESDPEARRAIYLELSQKVMEDALAVPLIDELSVWALRPGYSGLLFNGYTYPIITELVGSE
jgi:peptide/nickel transport system substrate-binding protein